IGRHVTDEVMILVTIKRVELIAIFAFLGGCGCSARYDHVAHFVLPARGRIALELARAATGGEGTFGGSRAPCRNSRRPSRLLRQLAVGVTASVPISCPIQKANGTHPSGRQNGVVPQ